MLISPFLGRRHGKKPLYFVVHHTPNQDLSWGKATGYFRPVTNTNLRLLALPSTKQTVIGEGQKSFLGTFCGVALLFRRRARETWRCWPTVSVV